VTYPEHLVSVSIVVSISACHSYDSPRETGVQFPDREFQWFPFGTMMAGETVFFRNGMCASSQSIFTWMVINLGEFLAWTFLDRDQLPARGSEEADEVEEYVRQFEEALGKELQQGYNRNVRSLRLTLDPVKMTHRSSAWYCVSRSPLGAGGWLICLGQIVGCIDAMTALRFRLYGLTLVSTKRWFQSFPVRPHALLVQSAQRSPSKDFSYWYRPHTAEGKVPVVFLHGLGILHPYVEFLGRG
jgi:hypothetical protein